MRTTQDEKKMKEKLTLCMFLALLGIFLLMDKDALVSYAASTVNYEEGDWSYTINTTDYVATITSYSGSATKPQIPTSITYEDREYTVTAIANGCFSENTSITGIVIPDTITTIGYGAFYKCTSLISVTIGSGVTTWTQAGSYNDYHWGAYPNFAFEGCTALTNLIIKSGAESIGSYAFYGCDHLTSVTIPETVQSIGNYAFYGCTKLTKAMVNNGIVGDGVFEDCSMLTLLTLQNVTGIGNCAFRNCVMLSDVTLPEELEYIGNEAFAGCTVLNKIDIPDMVATIGYGAFYGCTKLTKVTIGSGVTTWTQEGSYNDYHWGEHPNFAFEQCTSLKTLVVKDGASSIGSYAFYDCVQLQSVSLPESIEDIGNYAFYNCTDINSVSIANGTIGDSAFENCTSISSLEIKKSTWIGNRAFMKCTSFEEVVLPEDLQYVGNEAFAECHLLNSIIIPDKVNTIGYAAFYNCMNMESAVVGKGVTTWTQMGSYNDYHWGERPNSAFEGCTALKQVTVGRGVTNIADYAFYKCTALESIELPDTVIGVGKYAFYNCDSLQNVSVNGGVISAYAFAECTGLTSLSLMGLTDIGDAAFKNCTGVESVILPSTLKNIGNEAFYGTGLTEICVPNAVQKLGYGAFAYCENMIDAIIGSAVTTWTGTESYNDYHWGENTNSAFEGNISLKNVYFCDGISSIGTWTFYNCPSLEYVYIPTTMTTYGKNCFETLGENLTLCVVKGSKQAAYAEENGYNYKEVTDISNADITLSKTQYTFSGEAYTPDVEITYNGTTLNENEDYRLVYYNNVDVGAATVLVLGKGEYGNTTNKVFSIDEKTMDDKTFTVEFIKDRYVYTGQEIEPDIIVRDGDLVLTKDKDYMLYYSDNVNVGTVDLEIVGIGNYSGTISAQYVIYEDEDSAGSESEEDKNPEQEDGRQDSESEEEQDPGQEGGKEDSESEEEQNPESGENGEDGKDNPDEKTAGKIIVKYVDEEGNEIADSVTLSGEAGESYATSAKTVEGYILKKIPENAEGFYVQGEITVSYVYQVVGSVTDLAKVLLSEITPSSINGYFEQNKAGGVKAVDGTVYEENVVVMDSSSNYYKADGNKDSTVEYTLNGQYDTFSGKVVSGDALEDSNDHTGSNVSIYFAIWGDDILLFEAQDLNRNSINPSFSLDVSNVKTLRIVANNSGSYAYGFFFIVDGVFTYDPYEKAQKDEAAASMIKDSIDKIGTVTLDSEEAIREAREAYDQLTDDQKALVDNYDTLLEAEEALNQLREAAQKQPDISNQEQTGNNPGTSSQEQGGNKPGTSSQEQSGNQPGTSSQNQNTNNPGTSSQNQNANQPGASSQNQTGNNSGTQSSSTMNTTTTKKTVKDKPTKVNIKNKKTYKTTKKVTVKDADGLKSIKLNSKTIKVKKGKKSVSFKLSKYKKYLKKKGKWNKLVITDVNKKKKTIKFKTK